MTIRQGPTNGIRWQIQCFNLHLHQIFNDRQVTFVNENKVSK